MHYTALELCKKWSGVTRWAGHVEHAVGKRNAYRILVGNPSGVPRNFVRGGGGSTNSVEDRENGDLRAVAP